MRLPSLLLLPTVLLLGLTACGSDEPGLRQAATPLPEVTASSAPTTSAPTAPITPAPTTPTSSAPAPTTPAFPKAVTAPIQGGSYVAVYLAVVKAGASTAPAVTARAEAKAAGYETGTGDIDCDQGARAALKLDKSADYMGTSIFFATAALAKQFVDAYQPGVIGTAPIKAYCLD